MNGNVPRHFSNDWDYSESELKYIKGIYQIVCSYEQHDELQ
jgi:hypothetical protein